MKNLARNSLLKNILNRGGVISDELKNSNFEISQCSSYYFANIITKPASAGLIHESTYTGFSKSPEIAMNKAISEFFERKLTSSGTASDGYAAFPVVSNKVDSLVMARSNALNEATERLVFANYWDTKSNAKVEIINKCSHELFNLVNDYAPIEKIYRIEPTHTADTKLIIFFVKLVDCGYISGAACGAIHDELNIIERALAELIRHAIAFSRNKNQGIVPQSFYEKRLCYFARGLGNILVEERINSKSKVIIELPSLKIDNEVPHDYSDLITVYQCLYENQPLFIGGDLERLCL